jgi:hypothetical protein
MKTIAPVLLCALLVAYSIAQAAEQNGDGDRRFGIEHAQS